jgi:putative acetyltransferase
MIFRALRRDETGEAARVHRLGMETMVDFQGRHTPEEDWIFYRDTVFEQCTITGAFSNGLLIGHVAWQKGWIEHLHVDPAHQGRGVGATLLEGVKAQLDDIQLWTFQTNREARRFYERHGFSARQFTEGEANDERRPDVRYRWRRSDPRR